MIGYSLCIGVREQMWQMKGEPSKEEQEDALKKLVHQNGMCLLIYPEGSNTSLLTALAETIHTNE